MNEKQEYIISRLNDIQDIAQELMDTAIIGQDGNLNEMSYHIKCYSKKIIVHLLKEWKNNIKFEARKEEKRKTLADLKQEEDEQVRNLNKQIFKKFIKNGE